MCMCVAFNSASQCRGSEPQAPSGAPAAVRHRLEVVEGYAHSVPWLVAGTQCMPPLRHRCELSPRGPAQFMWEYL